MKKSLVSFSACMLAIFIASGSVDANWAGANGSDGRIINVLAVRGGNIFAGTMGNGVFLSTNNGKTWNAVNNGLPENAAAMSIAMHDSHLFAAMNDMGVYGSPDNGANWTALNNDLPESAIVPALAIHGGNFFAGTEGKGVFLSPDNGASWTAVNNGLPATIWVWSLTARDSSVFAGTTKDGIFLSTDNGTNWKAVNNGLPANVAAPSIVIRDTNVFAGTAGSGVFLSTGNGTNWKAINAGLPANPSVKSLAAKYGLLFAAIDTSGVFLSADDGTTWRSINDGLIDTSVWSLAVSDSTVFAGTKGGIIWRRPLSEIVPFVTLDLQQEYVMPDNYYHFTWLPVPSASQYEIYGNDVLIYRCSDQTLSYREWVDAIIETIEKVTGETIERSVDTTTFYLVARSNANRVIAVSKPVPKRYVMYIGTRNRNAIQKSSGIHIAGSSIDCSSLKGTIRIALYSINGARVWSTEGSGRKIMVPELLPRGVYTVEVTGVSAKSNGVVVRK